MLGFGASGKTERAREGEEGKAARERGTTRQRYPLLRGRGATRGLSSDAEARRPCPWVATERGEEDDRGDFAPSPLEFSFSFLPALFSVILFLISITDLNLNY